MGVENAAGAFLIGCGPSLTVIDVQRLAAYDTITFNRAYIAWARWGFAPTYYACFDPIAVADNAAEIRELIAEGSVETFFLNDVAARHGMSTDDCVRFVTLIDRGAFSTDLTRLGDFGNVGASSLQVLAALGYRRVVLVGVDARYIDLGRSVGDHPYAPPEHDRDHFDRDYLRGKRRLADPSFDTAVGQWPRVANACRARGLEVRNATSGSALTCFERIEFEDALEWIVPQGRDEVAGRREVAKS